MLNYAVNSKIMKKWLISEGTAECEVFKYWKNPEKEVTIFSTSMRKWQYLNELGLVTSPQEKVAIHGTWFNHAWKFNAVKLVPLTDNEWDKLSEEISPERSIASDWYWRNSNSMYDLDASQFNRLRPAVEFLNKFKLNCRLDAHQYNWLKCPVTGTIFPYDAIYFDGA